MVVTPQSRDRAGRFAGRPHSEADLALPSTGPDLKAVVDSLAVDEMVPTSGHLGLLHGDERRKVNARMTTFCKEWIGFLSDPDFMATCPVVSAADGSGLVTGQVSVSAEAMLDMPDDLAERIAAGRVPDQAWDPLPVVVKIGRQRVVRDGHHRMMRRLLVGEPIEYRYVTEADLVAWQGRPL